MELKIFNTFHGIKFIINLIHFMELKNKFNIKNFNIKLY
jgi:hypothetical protein